ncbi:MAG: 2-succinyl-5-enolpyruvyl-6-hydroxy-3-cyclohexene-1-carboxylic-acid synthase [Reichenbachiella sp.]|uniref:2-succinyl-5-enolpyruvyl-6-hydroxy-3- cyclohexene-1-carboxylic-acid synthase n=1 Tax=Reichenbachiella sp. TaxID=2184521 RepID=UPI002966BEA7|nr:2-succinyl-5-enolpyruvyl-6-hydroxy-3-cyclohexene-1-carboxylic-acid synthase [Reichenbachiella sp.]MDW3210767.1 2-succinyl-5-enolpyruvyl-6-hydroxy-3-cyclohexene-1-carboxylic-acid synthase [Reichenbachiella sp.]
MNLQSVFDLVQICHLKGVKHAVISPGSRNAALTIAFSRHPEIECYSVPDERSAAFIALGISLKTKLPTVLICTSGSAALNYAPAVAEAYFNQVPLLILSADRPPEWIGQRDGQTIYQEQLFGNHVKKSLVFPSLEETEEGTALGHETINQAINCCLEAEMGPVHINIPFREPFYPTTEQGHNFSKSLPVFISDNAPLNNWKSELKDLSNFSRVLIIVGQSTKDPSTIKLLTSLSIESKIPIVADVISNAHQVEDVISSQDVFLKGSKDTNLQPDLLITIGMSVISKNLKLFLRDLRPKAHWHVRQETKAPDTYLSLAKHFAVSEIDFLKELEQIFVASDSQRTFQGEWSNIDSKTKKHIEHFGSDDISDFDCYKKVLHALPSGSDLHLANSMAVRYANVIGLSNDKDIEVYCNRGTSGIDGSNSTAVGTAIVSQRPTFLLTGDMAFLYDRNGFWHNHVPENLSIVVFNNHGGGIFRMIEGPSGQPELEEFFETHQQKDASHVAKEFGFEYYPCTSLKELEQNLIPFVKTGKRKILEVFTDAEVSKNVYKELFRSLS